MLKFSDQYNYTPCNIRRFTVGGSTCTYHINSQEHETLTMTVSYFCLIVFPLTLLKE